MGLLILIRAVKHPPLRTVHWRWAPPLGLVGGFADAVGGGGWGATVTAPWSAPARSPAGGRHGQRRRVLRDLRDLRRLPRRPAHRTLGGRGRLAGSPGRGRRLVLGGVLAAPLAGRIVKVVPARVLTWMVGVLVITLACYQGAQVAGWI
jgi:uncharacterized membrane protein YfcA